MRNKASWPATALAGLLAASGCATTHLPGEYRPSPGPEVAAEKHDRKTIATGSEWLFLWGLLDTGHFDVNEELRKNVRSNEAVTNLEVKDRLSVGGALLWIITAGIVSHHTIVVKGEPARIHETSGTPSSTTNPAGYPSRDHEANPGDGNR